MKKSKEIKKAEKPLTIRERRLIKGITTGLSVAEAARRAGYAPSTADKKGKSLVGKSRVQEAIKDVMERRGLSDDRLFEVVERGLEATKVISATVIRGGPDSVADDQNGMKDAHSMTKDFIDVPDYPTQHKFVVTCLELKGHLKPPKTDVNHSGTITFEIKPA